MKNMGSSRIIVLLRKLEKKKTVIMFRKHVSISDDLPYRVISGRVKVKPSIKGNLNLIGLKLSGYDLLQ